MLNKFFQLSDDQIKDLFDHFRNIGICSAIFAASDWQYSQIGPLNSGLSIFNAFIYSLLVAVGAILLLIVLVQAFRKFRACGLKGFKLKLIYCAYSLGIVSLIISIFVH